jgi:hypothetical protein
MPGSCERLRAALARIPDEVREAHVADARVLHLPAQRRPWTDTGMPLEAGVPFSLFAEGRVVLSEEARLWHGPALRLWARVGGAGPLHNGARATASFVAERSGPLELGIYVGEWADRDGALDTPDEGYAMLGGGIDVLAVRWKGSALRGVRALASAVPDEPLFRAERDRLEHPVPVPEGWSYLWFLGPADIYRPTRVDGRPGIRAETRDDVGILVHPVDLPLSDDATLSWRWRVDALPSAVAEDTLPTHDYLSIAVEFENGRDLTYYWSAALPVGTSYHCPLPDWDQRETHWVVRSGSEGIGRWQDESRRLRPDYQQAVGAPPERIVAVWLIAVSLFQHGEGAAEFSDVWLEAAGERRQVL